LGDNRILTLPDVDLTLTQYSGPNQSLVTTGTPQFSKLGINQASGTEALEITGNIKAVGSAPTLSLIGTNAGIIDLITTTSSGKHWQMSSNTLGNMYFTDLTDVRNLMILRADNKIDIPATCVGINKSAGTYPLEVSGAIQSTDIRSDSDYIKIRTNIASLSLQEGTTYHTVYTFPAGTYGTFLASMSSNNSRFGALGYVAVEDGTVLTAHKLHGINSDFSFSGSSISYQLNALGNGTYTFFLTLLRFGE
jgi:hypothetical protein